MLGCACTPLLDVSRAFEDTFLPQYLHISRTFLARESVRIDPMCIDHLVEARPDHNCELLSRVPEETRNLERGTWTRRTWFGGAMAASNKYISCWEPNTLEALKWTCPYSNFQEQPAGSSLLCRQNLGPEEARACPENTFSSIRLKSVSSARIASYTS